MHVYHLFALLCSHCLLYTNIFFPHFSVYIDICFTSVFINERVFCVSASATLIRLKFKPELEDMIINTIFIYIHRVNEKHIPLTKANRIDYSFVDVIIFFFCVHSLLA